MPKVSRANTISQTTVLDIIFEVNAFLAETRNELLGISSSDKGVDYTVLANIIDETIDASALQPKIHALIGISTCLSVEMRRDKVTPYYQCALRKLHYEISEFVLKLITDF